MSNNEKKYCPECEVNKEISAFKPGNDICKTCQNRIYKQNIKRKTRCTDDGVALDKFYDINGAGIYCY